MKIELTDRQARAVFSWIQYLDAGPTDWEESNGAEEGCNSDAGNACREVAKKISKAMSKLKLTDERISLWLHLVSEHATAIGPELSMTELLDMHKHEHHGPGGIRNHDEESRAYQLKTIGEVLSELEPGDK